MWIYLIRLLLIVIIQPTKLIMEGKVALICIAKDEDLYLQEWIDFNLKLGFDSIHIYQNDWRFLNKKENTKVFFHEFDGKMVEGDDISIQKKCYDKFIQDYHNVYEWAAFFDCDEFLVLKKHNNIKEFISDYSDYKSIAINWVLFGDNNLEFTSEETSVLKRFTKRKSSVSQLIKVIAKLEPDLKHHIHFVSNNWVDTNYKLGPTLFSICESNSFGSDDVAQLNHYFVKTYHEWSLKRKRFQAYSTTMRKDEDFDEHNFNEIDDFLARDFLYGKTNKITKKN